MSMISSVPTAVLPIHKTMLPYLEKEGVSYSIDGSSLVFPDLCYVEIAMTAEHLQAFLHAGIHIGQEASVLAGVNGYVGLINKAV